MDSITLGAESVIEFTVVDAAGRGAVGLEAGRRGNVRFSLAKLVPPEGPGDPSAWQSMVNRVRGDPPDQAFQAYYDREGELVDNQDGTYVYTFDNDLTAQTNPITGEAITWEPDRTHRLVMQVSGRVNGRRLPPVNDVRDLVPNGGDVTERRDIIETSSCNECHGNLRFHGHRYEAGYCVVCHNTGTETVGTDRPLADMSYMTHAIHAARKRAADGAPEFELGGENYGNVTYPQGLQQCRKCHEQSENAPQGDNWKDVPNENSCGGCHASDFYNGHVENQTNESCVTCHGPGSGVNLCGEGGAQSCAIETVHLTENPTTNNPNVPQGAAVIEYEFDEVTIDGNNRASIRFRILRDGNPIDLLDLDDDLDNGRWPSFLLSYAVAQDGITMPIDYNNLGQPDAQPVRVNLDDIGAGNPGTGSGPDGTLTADTDGYFIAAPSFQFPAGSMMRSATLQGYFRQSDVPVFGTMSRHAISPVAFATGDMQRRDIVDSAKCANCHEWFEAHGGNRVYNVQACATCHNPNLTSSGRTFDASTLSPAEAAEVAAILGDTGVLPSDPTSPGALDGSNALTWPEESQNMRELIHGIHAASVRSNDFAFVRVFRGSPRPYNFSEITYPDTPANCEACHLPGTYDTMLPEGELVGTRITLGADPADRQSLLAARDTVPNLTDIVTTPAAAACVACHDSGPAAFHMRLNGALVNEQRLLFDENTETCNVCHGPGRVSDTAAAHGN
jgi:OmcA/MtrC family decaheme c-type cytochrome